MSIGLIFVMIGAVFFFAGLLNLAGHRDTTAAALCTIGTVFCGGGAILVNLT